MADAHPHHLPSSFLSKGGGVGGEMEGESSSPTPLRHPSLPPSIFPSPPPPIQMLMGCEGMHHGADLLPSMLSLPLSPFNTHTYTRIHLEIHGTRTTYTSTHTHKVGLKHLTALTHTHMQIKTHTQTHTLEKTAGGGRLVRRELLWSMKNQEV